MASDNFFRLLPSLINTNHMTHYLPVFLRFFHTVQLLDLLILQGYG